MKNHLARLLILLIVLLSMTSCVVQKTKADALTAAMLAYGNAIRWDELESALSYIHPDYLKDNPITRIDLERFKQIRITRYYVTSSAPSANGQDIVESVQVRLINRHTQKEREITARNEWRYDDDDKRWWLYSSLPDITQNNY